MKFRNIHKKEIYIKDYSKEAGGISFRGIFSFFDYTLKIIILTLLPIAVFTFAASKMPVFGIQSFVVLSGSMEPTLPVGSIVYSLKDQAYGVKDVLSFQTASGMTVTHRVMEVIDKPQGVFYRVKGDANNSADSDLIAQKNVLGKAVTLLPFLGYPIVALKTLPGFIGFIIVPSFLFILFELLAIKREIEKEMEKKVLGRLQMQ